MSETEALVRLFRETRERTERLVEPLAPDDLASGSIPGVPPAKWRLGRAAWFVDTCFLDSEPSLPGGGVFARAPRPGGFPRPTIAEIMEYRRLVDRAVRDRADAGLEESAKVRLALAAFHEADQAELLLASVKHLFATSPLAPAYASLSALPSAETPPLRFLEGPGGTTGIGRDREALAPGSETPRHRRRVAPFRIASRLTTNREYLEFIEDGGYREEGLWLRDGWRVRCREGWEHPVYWKRHGEIREEFTLGGWRPLAPDAPVAHLSYFEADAFARWRECRLPNEFEWESVAATVAPAGCLLESRHFAPSPVDSGAASGRQPAQLYGDVWEWTSSGFEPYPGYRCDPAADAVIFGDFSPGRMVVRGGSCLTSGALLRASTRRALRPATRWECTGIRLARAA